MANFTRSFKPSSYLSPRLRPSMPGRTISASSDLSLSAASSNSPHSEDNDPFLSGRNTPSLSGVQRNIQNVSQECDGSSSPGITAQGDKNTGDPDRSRNSDRSRSRSRTRPIAIELPQLKRFSTAPARTPPEPLSARGDLPGGYFPLHEDPNSRIHRPHPFQRQGEARKFHRSLQGPVLEHEHADGGRPATTSTQRFSMAQTSTPVASYIAPGFHDNPLPVGKYYPSNYENRNNRQRSWRSGELQPQNPHLSSSGTSAESDVRRKLQQYQRDMIAQASMAASELLSGRSGSSGKADSTFPIREIQLHTQAHLRPNSPKLLPMGSPGPVTPMSLESGSVGGYLDIRKQEGTNIKSPLTGEAVIL